MPVRLTEGSVLRNIAVFSLPYFLSYFLQTFYGMADLLIAGQFNGAAVISAVSVGSQVMHMLTVVLTGLSMGSTVLIARAVGAGRDGEVSRVAGTTVTLFAGLSLALTLILLACTRGIVRCMAAPPEAVAQTERYLRICFAGIPFITAYNVVASLFRGMGDSRRPLVFIAVACVVNIALDCLFMGVLGMQAEGAALATVIAQALSVAVSLCFLRGSASGVTLRKEHFLPHAPAVRGILGIGLPVACQDGFIQVSFLLITVIANRRGVTVAAAVGIVEKIISFLFLVPSSMLSAISAIAAQCVGAGEGERARRTLWCGTAIAFAAGVVFAAVFQFAARPVLALFTDDAEVVRLGTQYLRSYVLDCVVAAVHFSFSGYFCALGKSIVSFVHNALSIVLVRVPGAWLASRLWPDTLFPMGAAAPLGSLLSALICLVVFWYGTEKAAPRRNSAPGT